MRKGLPVMHTGMFIKLYIQTNKQMYVIIECYASHHQFDSFFPFSSPVASLPLLFAIPVCYVFFLSVFLFLFLWFSLNISMIALLSLK